MESVLYSSRPGRFCENQGNFLSPRRGLERIARYIELGTGAGTSLSLKLIDLAGLPLRRNFAEGVALQIKPKAKNFGAHG
jgi:hypothetical protein